MFVRTAGERDMDAVRALLIETWHATYDAIHGVEKVNEITSDWHSIPSLNARLARPNSEFLIADDGERIGGMAFAETDATGAQLELRQLYILPSFQGRGIGSMLLEEIIESFPEAKTIRLEVDERNTKAVHFYMAHGFAQTGRTENCGAQGSGLPALIFEMPII